MVEGTKNGTERTTQCAVVFRAVTERGAVCLPRFNSVKPEEKTQYRNPTVVHIAVMTNLSQGPRRINLLLRRDILKWLTTVHFTVHI